ncbi:NB-ARC domain-containing protein [Cryptosporangium sp. NPDC051539]|uniref:NB-ARC domain-containing protein n=1 Tax=Cryptosporangium sp. NPDC051539 TaxID=3363962 RepID=UPI00379ABE5C
MARPEGKLPARNNPITQLAGELRTMRRRAGSPAYREMAGRANFSASVLAAAAAGHALPTLPVTKAFVLACGGDPKAWEARWYEVSAQLGRVRDLPASVAPAPATERSSPSAPAQIPPDIADFTGRASELEMLATGLRGHDAGSAPDSGATVLVGPGGIGKTAIAVRAAHQWRAAYSGGQLFVRLNGHGDQPVNAREALGRVLRALGVPEAQIPDDAEERSAMYRTRLVDRPTLVVLDDVPDEAVARLLLPPTSRSACIVTSRSALLGLEGVDRVQITGFSETTAVRFLTRLVGADRIAAEPDAAAQLVSLCCGLPLALRVSGTRLAARPNWPLSTYVSYLAGENTRLSELAAGDLTVRSRLAHSYQRLDDRSQVMFRRLALMPGLQFRTAAAAAVIGDTVDAARHDLEALTDANLLTSPAPDRYGFHHLGQLFARECLVRAESPAVVSQADDRLCSWYEQAARAAARMFARGAGALGGHPAQIAFASREAACEWLNEELAASVQIVGRLAIGATPERAVVLLNRLGELLQDRELWGLYQSALEHGRRAARSIGDAAGEAAIQQRLDLVRRKMAGTAA